MLIATISFISRTHSELPPVSGSSGNEASYNQFPSKPISLNMVTPHSRRLQVQKHSDTKRGHCKFYKSGLDAEITKGRQFNPTGRNVSIHRISSISQLEQVEETDDLS